MSPAVMWSCVSFCVHCAESMVNLPVNNSPTGRTAAVAADDKPLSPVQRYVSYDERPLPAIRRCLLGRPDW